MSSWYDAQVYAGTHHRVMTMDVDWVMIHNVDVGGAIIESVAAV